MWGRILPLLWPDKQDMVLAGFGCKTVQLFVKLSPNFSVILSFHIHFSTRGRKMYTIGILSKTRNVHTDPSTLFMHIRYDPHLGLHG